MQYVLPQLITFDTTNATDEALSEWVTATTYQPGDEVKIAAEKRKYKNTYAIATQSDITPGSDPDNWVPGPLNSVAMLDDSNSTGTTNASTIDVTYQASGVDTIALFNLKATQVQVIVTDNSGPTEIFNETRDLVEDILVDFGDYLYEDEKFAEFTVFSVPDAFDAEIQIIITEPGTAECGYLINGRAKELGVSLFGAVSGLQTTATRVRNVWGDVQFTPGVIYDTMDLPVQITAGTVDTVKLRLSGLLDTPCLFIGDESGSYKALSIYGFFFDFEIPVTRVLSTYTLRIEGLL